MLKKGKEQYKQRLGRKFSILVYIFMYFTQNTHL